MAITLDEILLDASTSSISIGDGTDTLDINADGSLNATVTATDLDIRDLVNTQDSVAIGDETDLVDMQEIDAAFDVGAQAFPIAGIRQDAGGSPVSATGDAHPLVFNNNGELKVAANLSSSVSDDEPYTEMPIPVGGRGVDGGTALSALSASNDKFDLLGDLYRRVWVNKSANVAIANSSATVTTTAAEVLASPLAGRQTVTIQNRGNQTVYIGSSVGVTSANGVAIPGRSSATYDFGEAIDIFMIAESGSQSVRFLEVA